MEINITINSKYGSVTVMPDPKEDLVELKAKDWRDDGVKHEEMSETERDEMQAVFFKSGWDSAVREAQLNYVNGRLEEFFNELVPVPEGFDPHHNEPEGTGEAPLVRKVTDSGEPEIENGDSSASFSRGVWTISDEELQALKDAEFERGQNYVSPTVPPRYSDEEIAELIAKERKIKFSSIRGAFDRAVAKADQHLKEWHIDGDNDPKYDTPPDRNSLVLNNLFTDLGFEVA